MAESTPQLLTREEHVEKALSLLRDARHNGIGSTSRTNLLAEAQLHATLASLTVEPLTFEISSPSTVFGSDTVLPDLVTGPPTAEAPKPRRTRKSSSTSEAAQ